MIRSSSQFASRLDSFAEMSAPGPKEAIDAINACAGLTTAQKAAARAKCMDASVVSIITATPAAERADTILQLLAPSQASTSAQSAGQPHRRAAQRDDIHPAGLYFHLHRSQ
jgi:hypothetical protein